MSYYEIEEGLKQYKKKHFQNRLVKGSLLTLISFISLFVLIQLMEGYFWFSSSIRLFLLIILVLSFALPVYLFIITPLIELTRLKKPVQAERFAKEIGNYFPEISDKLLNLLQLNSLAENQKNLVFAAVQQKSQELSDIDFSRAISWSVVYTYLKVFLIVISFGVLVYAVRFEMLNGSTTRILNFQNEYTKPAPFNFLFENNSFIGFRNENFDLSFSIDGNYLPNEVILITENREIRLSSEGGNYHHEFQNLQNEITFYVKAAGFKSKSYTIAILDRPELRALKVGLKYPNYTQRAPEEILNSGNLTVPVGTTLSFSLESDYTNIITFVSTHDSLQFSSTGSEFVLAIIATNSTPYEIRLENDFSSNKSKIEYFIETIADQSPEIEAHFYPDSTLFQSVAISGSISDDYGFSRLYIKCKSQHKEFEIPLVIQQYPSKQSFIYEFRLDSVSLSEGPVELWVTVSDNDGVNGPKQASSQHFTFGRPQKKALTDLLNELQKSTEKTWENTTDKAQDINDLLKGIEERLKNNDKIGWQEEKMVKDLLRNKEELTKEINELQEKNTKLNESQKEFSNLDERISAKAEELQKQIDALLDDETKKLYEELQKLMEEKSSANDVSKKISQIKSKEKNLERDLERSLELFKRLKLETEIFKSAKELDELGEKQLDLADSKQSQEEQNKVVEEFNEIEKNLEKISKMNQELKRPEALENLTDFSKDLKDDLLEISEELNKNQSEKASEKQRNTGSKMKQMATKMKQMQSALEMDAMQENIDNLRDILDNLIRLSFEEERIFLGIQGVDQVDPRYLTFAQNQLTLINNAKVIEDSLLSLGSRVIQINGFVTREIGEIDENLDFALNDLKAREKNKAVTHQQFAMTSMNNLALLLDNTLQQMQMAMSEAMGKPKPGQGNPRPQLSQQQQELGEKIQKLGKEGKSSRELSEQLAKLAAEQAQIREQLQESEKQNLGLKPGEASDKNAIRELIEKLEKNEDDLVNKRVNQALIDRQKDITTRMLEAEKSIRDQDKKEERESKSARQKAHEISGSFEEYLKKRKKEIELLNTAPLDLLPFYKKEVNDYFRRLSSADN